MSSFQGSVGALFEWAFTPSSLMWGGIGVSYMQQKSKIPVHIDHMYRSHPQPGPQTLLEDVPTGCEGPNTISVSG